MSLFDRRTFLALAGAGLTSACGFEPVYKSGSAADDLQGQILVNLVSGRNAFELRNQLINRLGHAPDSALYTLTFTLEVSSTGLATSETEGTTRYNLAGVAGFSITRTGTEAVVFSDEVSNFTAYSATSATYPTRVAELDANIRLSKALAEQIVARIATTASSWH